ncbi:MAG: prepilin-type N-terminal cleavage/methylation domain-containing protein [Magnetococcales bacterium]|nr:prepilin-type N-terminal cleavage/methylation domain-containing protein [Magnetococcales bacterium]MBF0174615.1 prepilin-type N-terminal cleavage/methylation domain-containing protein [Magnetococcales bacterium]MBF0347393.1 prepilin-type N-terminal cleavage/methylation domain-containing protein [Magnetococcales bacterium]MBF0630636.1 prepilin-type N-terminal cleavage/methylation domain-containing protein [Magnetococcales bacterium]
MNYDPVPSDACGRGSSGFTLLELVITLVIAGICAGLGWQSFITATESTILRAQLSAVSDQGRLAMVRLTRELREARRDGFVLSPNTEITFLSTATGDGLVRYYLDGTNLRRTILSNGEDNLLAKGISDLTFSYDTNDSATFNHIQVQFHVNSWVPGNELVRYPLRSRIYPRNF